MPRAVRMRNALLRRLAATRELPVPADDDLAQLDARTSLADAAHAWELRHRPADARARERADVARVVDDRPWAVRFMARAATIAGWVLLAVAALPARVW